jgi:SNF2 family DNA or RNA helicase
MPVTDMIQHLLGATPATIEFTSEFPDDRMNLAITYNKSKVNDINYLAFNVINGIHGLSVTKKTEKRTVYSISKADEKKLADITSKKSNVMTSISYEGNEWVGSNVNITILINFLESELRAIFKDNTALNAPMNIRFDKTDIDKALKSLESLGFEISKSEEDVEITIVEKVK